MDRFEDVNSREKCPPAHKGRVKGGFSAIGDQLTALRELFAEVFCDEIGPFSEDRERVVRANLKKSGWCQIRPSDMLTVDAYGADLYQRGHETKILRLGDGRRVIYVK